jgi:hypothetical protein
MSVIGWEKYQPALKKRAENKELYNNRKAINPAKNLLSANKRLKVLVSAEKDLKALNSTNNHLVKHESKVKESKVKETVPPNPLKGDENPFSISDWSAFWQEFRDIALQNGIVINWTPDNFEKKDLILIANDCKEWEKYCELIDQYLIFCTDKNIKPIFKGLDGIKLFAQNYLTKKNIPKNIIQSKIHKIKMENGELLECEEKFLIEALGKLNINKSKDTLLLFMNNSDKKSRLELFQEAIKLKNPQ